MSDNVMNWSDRISAAAKILEQKPEYIEAVLASPKLGIKASHGVEALDSEDFKIADVFDAFEGHGKTVVRMAFRALKGGKSDKPAVEVAGTGDSPFDARMAQLRGFGIKTRPEDAPLSVLLPLYNPDWPNDPITKALKARFGDKPVIAFRADGRVATDEVIEYMSDIEQGVVSGEADAIEVDGELTKLFPVGVKPNVMVDEDPLFPGKPLRRGYSTVNHRNWSDISLVNRQFCRIVVNLGQLDVNNNDAVLRIIERAATTTGMGDVPDKPAKSLRCAYPEAALEFNSLAVKGDLPKLKVQIGGSAPKANNPFGVKRQY